MCVSLKNEYDGNYLRYTNTLKDCKIDWMKDCVSDSYKLIPYKYPTSLEFKKNNIQIIFLSAFWNDWSFSNNAKISILHGLKIKEDSVEKTGDLFGVTALDDNWLSINQMIKYYKFGFGRVTDYLNFEIRSGKIKRKEAIVIAQKYDGKCSIEYIKDFCRYIDITLEEFYKNISKFVNKKLFTIDLNKSENKFLPKFKVGTDL